MIINLSIFHLCTRLQWLWEEYYVLLFIVRILAFIYIITTLTDTDSTTSQATFWTSLLYF